MKTLPKDIQLVTTTYGDGTNGYAFQKSRSKEYGVQCDATRAYTGSDWIAQWSHDELPYQWFPTYEALVEAWNNPQAYRAEVRTRVLKVEPPSWGSVGKCWNCRGEWSWTVRTKTGWRFSDISLVISCDDCLELILQDPLAIIEKRREWVREKLESARRALYDVPSAVQPPAPGGREPGGS